MLSLARLVELMEADQITLARRQRRTIAETLATTAGRLRLGGDLTARMDSHLGPAIKPTWRVLLACAAGCLRMSTQSHRLPDAFGLSGSLRTRSCRAPCEHLCPDFGIQGVD